MDKSGSLCTKEKTCLAKPDTVLCFFKNQLPGWRECSKHTSLFIVGWVVDRGKPSKVFLLKRDVLEVFYLNMFLLRLLCNFFFKNCICLFMYRRPHVPQLTHEGQRATCWASSPLPLYILETELRDQPWQQAPRVTEPPHWPLWFRTLCLSSETIATNKGKS